MCHSSQRSSAAPSLSSSQSSLPTSARGSCVMASDDYEAGYMHNHRISPAVKGSTAFSQDTKSGSNALPGSAENAAFQKRVLTLLHSIRYEVQDISSQLSHSLSKLSIHKDVDEHEKLFEEPINNLDDFVEFDNQLRNNKQKQTEVRTFLAMFGGRGTADHVARILSRVITNDLATEFSWFGARGKRSFKDLAFADLLCGCTMHTMYRLSVESIRSSLPKDKHNTTFKDIEDAVKSWLRHAKERKDRQAEKTSKGGSS
ncbi:uncharacterized protein LOC135389448 [Ornithodoros turicata]|uniref:uncharacterized protein LOC135389448 n=1 Tax=Ornithodoros turicata TaxID=34597 RepID=UPI003139E568